MEEVKFKCHILSQACNCNILYNLKGQYGDAARILIQITLLHLMTLYRTEVEQCSAQIEFIKL